ncbi:hypothetical protein [Crossiella sp. NPDC003009]
MSHTTRLARGLLALATLSALFAAPAAATPAPAATPACAAPAAGPCVDGCRRKKEDGLRNCDLAHDRCLRNGTDARKCREQRLRCRNLVEDSHRRCLATCTRRSA